MQQTTTNRGFDLIEFEDRYKQQCSLQKSSLATQDCIWFGVTKDIPIELGGTGQDVHARMHLTQDMVKQLLPHLLQFAETGEIYIKQN